ncbi:MAG: hypothetical protein RLZZ241_196 [Bacteroidota bacterium]|jgi:ABC-2 type transport system ATP-binding protein
MSISVNQVSKQFGSQLALDQVSFEIQKGEIVGFLGPNGAGKSTLMKILTTIYRPDSGRAEVNGYDIGRAPETVKRHLGYLPEHNPLYLELYVKEYLRFCAALHKVPAARIDTVIDMTGLTPEVNKRIGKLSKGYRQRVGLAAALIHDPEVLILDEPTTGLDPNQLVEIRKLIREIGKQKTILLSTHILKEVEAVCDRVLVLNSGKIVADKPLAALQEHETQIIEVEFDFRIEEQAFKTIPDLLKSIGKGGFIYELHFTTQEDRRPAVFDFAQAQGLKLLNLNRKSISLETLFQKLTQ